MSGSLSVLVSVLVPVSVSVPVPGLGLWVPVSVSDARGDLTGVYVCVGGWHSQSPDLEDLHNLEIFKILSLFLSRDQDF